jgi:hypothetical protein
MLKKISMITLVVLAVSWLALAQNHPQAPKPPAKMVQQTITRTTYVAPTNLETGTFSPHSNLPPSMTFVCHLYAQADQGTSATNSPGECPLPYRAKIDTSFRQQAFPTPCSGGGATTNLTVADVPQGIYLACDGGYYWAVIGPVRLEVLQFDNNGVVTQWGVHVEQLYCGPGGAPNGGCNVKLDIYAKLLP